MNIYMIGEDFLSIDAGEEAIETRVCHNFGAWETETQAQDKADKLNQTKDENAGTYFVLPIRVKTS